MIWSFSQTKTGEHLNNNTSQTACLSLCFASDLRQGCSLWSAETLYCYLARWLQIVEYASCLYSQSFVWSLMMNLLSFMTLQPTLQIDTDVLTHIKLFNMIRLCVVEVIIMLTKSLESCTIKEVKQVQFSNDSEVNSSE